MNPVDDPRVFVDQYVIRPSCYDELPEYERYNFCLSVVDGHAWGWSVRRGVGMSNARAFNRNGVEIYESRGSGSNKFRRWPLEEALTIALKHVDSMKVNGRTAQQWVDHWASTKEE